MYTVFMQICSATVEFIVEDRYLIKSLQDSSSYGATCLCKMLQYLIQDAQLSQRDRAAGCVIVLAKSRRLELGDNILRTL